MQKTPRSVWFSKGIFFPNDKSNSWANLQVSPLSLNQLDLCHSKLCIQPHVKRQRNHVHCPCPLGPHVQPHVNRAVCLLIISTDGRGGYMLLCCCGFQMTEQAFCHQSYQSFPDSRISRFMALLFPSLAVLSPVLPTKQILYCLNFNLISTSLN